LPNNGERLIGIKFCYILDSMTEPDLAFIARLVERVLSDGREIREELRQIREELRGLRQDFGLLREELRLLSDRVGRLEDTVRHDVLERIRRLLEARGH
jgi:predicted nuclease with TOPRIM domain